MRRPVLLSGLLLMSACRFGAARQERTPAAAAPLPPIAVYEISAPRDSGGITLAPVRSRDPLAGIVSDKRITLTTANQDVRMLLLWLAEQAGASMVISPDVNARITVSFRDVSVVEAMRAVMAEAGLSVLVGPMEAPWPPVVFYQLPVNINTASAEAIAARFGVSLEMARFIVESRVVKQP
jgi:hypothetical protein